MIKIDFDPATLTLQDLEWWSAWRVRAQKATNKLIDAFESWVAGPKAEQIKPNWNPEIWTELRTWFLKNRFCNKCAYCECDISGFYGDAEHYRPKGSVKFKDANQDFSIATWEIPADPPGMQWAHPGYFWLAYDWRNLVPACTFCNSGQGKNERFDVGERHLVLVALSRAQFDAFPDRIMPLPSRNFPGFYYLAPQTLDELERPLLLNPLNPVEQLDPKYHLVFGTKGSIQALDESPYGKNSIDVLKLDREDLNRRRQKAQETFRRDCLLALLRNDADAEDGGPAFKELLDRYKRGELLFSAAALASLSRIFPIYPQ